MFFSEKVVKEHPIDSLRTYGSSQSNPSEIFSNFSSGTIFFQYTVQHDWVESREVFVNFELKYVFLGHNMFTAF